MFFPSQSPSIINLSNLRFDSRGGNKVHQTAMCLNYLDSLTESGCMEARGSITYEEQIRALHRRLAHPELDPVATNEDGLTPLQLTLRKDIEPPQQEPSIFHRLWRRFTSQESYLLSQKPSVKKLRKSTRLIAKKILEKPLSLSSRPEPPLFSLRATYDTYKYLRNLFGKRKTHEDFRNMLIPDFFLDTKRFEYTPKLEYNKIPQHPAHFVLPERSTISPERLAYYIANAQIKDFANRYEQDQQMKTKLTTNVPTRRTKIFSSQKERLTELLHKIQHPRWWHWILPPLRLQWRSTSMKEEQLKRYQEARKKWDPSFKTT